MFIRCFDNPCWFNPSCTHPPCFYPSALFLPIRPVSPPLQDALFTRTKKVEAVYLLTKGTVALQFVRDHCYRGPPQLLHVAVVGALGHVGQWTDGWTWPHAYGYVPPIHAPLPHPTLTHTHPHPLLTHCGLINTLTPHPTPTYPTPPPRTPPHTHIPAHPQHRLGSSPLLGEEVITYRPGRRVCVWSLYRCLYLHH
jgi:hypothetical protein